MKKTLFTCLLSAFSLVLLAQNLTPLTYREAFNYEIGDTFQYKILKTHTGTSPNFNKYYVIRQVVVKKKNENYIPGFATTLNYIEQEQETGNLPSYQSTLSPYFSDAYNSERWEFPEANMNASVGAGHICPTISNPTSNNFCYDTLVLDYNNLKTFKHEFNENGNKQLSEHFVEGLGYAKYFLDYTKVGGSLYEQNLIYYNKNGEKWGERSTAFDNNKAKINPLTKKEVYNFEVNDVFIKQETKQNFQNGTIDTTYIRETIIDKKILLDTLKYTIKYEKMLKSKPLIKTTSTETVVITDLNAPTLTELKSDSGFILHKNIHSVLTNSNRRTFKRKIEAPGSDYCNTNEVGEGLGLIANHPCSVYWYSNFLIYFKKGNEEWGKNIDFPLTVRETYDFEVGDTLLYDISESTWTRRVYFNKLLTFQKKWFNNAKDSLFYQVKNEFLEKKDIKKTVIDTLVLTYLDSSILKYAYNDLFRIRHPNTKLIDTIYPPSEKYNQRKIVSRKHANGAVGDRVQSFAKGLGMVNAHNDIEAIGSIDTILIYFRKGIETWGKKTDFYVGLNTPSVSTPKIKLSPNPATESLNIDIDLPDFEIKIHDFQGKLCQKSDNTKVVNVAHLPNGLYFLQVHERGVLRGVSKFVVAR